MTRDEKRAGIALASIFGLRMLGLFLILPVFSVFAATLPGGDDVFLVGFALGAYGMTQALFQIPFGLASDRLGRKPVITAGLLVFAAGSFLAAAAPDIQWVIAGRVVQGAGAISAAVTALAADLTREQHRTKVMAMIGGSIGAVFAISLVAAPPLYAAVGMTGIFSLTGILALGAIVLLFRAVPVAPPIAIAERVPFSAVLRHGQLLRMNFGVLALHAMQTAMWVVVPPALVAGGGLPLGDHWKIYLPALLGSFVFMVPAVIIADRHGRTKAVFMAAIGLLTVVQWGLSTVGGGSYAIGFWLLLFFVAFNILEALQPSLISRIAPAAAKGAALGVYNTTQSVGLFLGGALGGWLLKHFGTGAVHGFSAALGFIWLVLAAGLALPAMRPAARIETIG
ncbi:MAG: MFS transporter [Candidatus Nitricoxidivorans perseverans]|uniref:MFS transporter n=1 Tax=Candidatus Nitricoxidivorans perseverans TaxID=2975601 RepID=A0AA49FKA1_9PROT|nr:MAG: MFS transporter [Candidatus Nitricoxidivorans perseverans]